MKNFIKFPFIRFRKSMLHKKLNKQLVEPDLQSKKWHDDLQVALESKDLKKIHAIIGDEQLCEGDALIDKLIKQFTLEKSSRRDFVELVKKLVVTYKDVEDLESEGPYLKITRKNGEIIEVYNLAETMPVLADAIPVIKGEDRQDECHSLSVLASVFADKAGVKNRIVTGYVRQLSENSKYLHSWVEYTDNGKAFVIDPTANAIVNKNGYYSYNHVGEVSKISSKTMRKEMQIFDELNDYDELLPLLYLTNREKALEIYHKQIEPNKLSK